VRETVTPVGIGPSKAATVSIRPTGSAAGRAGARSCEGLVDARRVTTRSWIWITADFLQERFSTDAVVYAPTWRAGALSEGARVAAEHDQTEDGAN
jgi:hypothetical protein